MLVPASTHMVICTMLRAVIPSHLMRQRRMLGGVTAG